MKLDVPRAPAVRWVVDVLRRLDVDSLLDTVARARSESLALSVEREHFSGFNAWVYLFLHFPPLLLLLLALLVWPTGGTAGALASIRALIVATLYALVMADVLARLVHGRMLLRGIAP